MAISFMALVDQEAVARETVQTVVIYTDGGNLCPYGQVEPRQRPSS
jgi:hypothetical protein